MYLLLISPIVFAIICIFLLPPTKNSGLAIPIAAHFYPMPFILLQLVWFSSTITQVNKLLPSLDVTTLTKKLNYLKYAQFCCLGLSLFVIITDISLRFDVPLSNTTFVLYPLEIIGFGTMIFSIYMTYSGRKFMYDVISEAESRTNNSENRHPSVSPFSLDITPRKFKVIHNRIKAILLSTQEA